MKQLDETLAEGAVEVKKRMRNIFWAERFENEATLLEAGFHDPMHPLILKARIESCRSVAADLRKQVADAEKTS